MLISKKQLKIAENPTMEVENTLKVVANTCVLNIFIISR